MNAIDETSKALRKAGYLTSHADDNVTCVRHDWLAVLRVDVREESSASKAIIKDLLRVLCAYGDPLIRHDRNGSMQAIFQTENGRSASLRDGRGSDFPGFRLRADDRVSRLVLGIDRDGIRTDGKWDGSRSPLNTPRRSLTLWPHEAENDLRDDLQAVLDGARERGEIRWAHEDATPSARSHLGELVNMGLSISQHPRDRDPSLPALEPEVAAEVIRRRIEAGLDQPPKPYREPGYG